MYFYVDFQPLLEEIQIVGKTNTLPYVHSLCNIGTFFKYTRTIGLTNQVGKCQKYVCMYIGSGST
jgi:hypothetical protein